MPRADKIKYAVAEKAFSRFEDSQLEVTNSHTGEVEILETQIVSGGELYRQIRVMVFGVPRHFEIRVKEIM